MKSRGNSPKMQRNTSPRLALEPRIVFDAAIGATAADAFDRHADRSEYVPPATNQATTSQPTRDARADAASPTNGELTREPFPSGTCVGSFDSVDSVDALESLGISGARKSTGFAASALASRVGWPGVDWPDVDRFTAGGTYSLRSA